MTLHWVSAMLLMYAVVNEKKLIRGLFVFGVLFHAVAFTWIPSTIEYFGGFPLPVSILLFALFIAVSSVQFLCVGWVYKRVVASNILPSIICFPLAWSSVEFLFPRLFPWMFAHPQLPWNTFSSLAEVVGVSPLSALFLFFAGVIIESLSPIISKTPYQRRKLVPCYIAIGLVLGFGNSLDDKVSAPVEGERSVAIALIQGNLEAKQKNDLKYFQTNMETYRRLSHEAIADGAELLVWPEAVLPMWVPEDISNFSQTQFDPQTGAEVPLLFGGMSYRRGSGANVMEIEKNSKFFNTAFSKSADGTLLGMYHKRILMPFGEYMPFAETFPAIQSLSPQTGSLSFGDILEPVKIEFKTGAAIPTMSAGILICYEDLVSSLSRALVQKGAQVLINLTNDAWYGDSPASFQHNMLAAWRAVEVRRFFLRATNTGHTTVIDPRGTVVSELGIFEEGRIMAQVSPSDELTAYVKWGDVASYVIIFLSVLIALRGLLKFRVNS